MSLDLPYDLNKTFYKEEWGFFLTVDTGLDMTGLVLGEITQVLKRPDGTTTQRDVLLADIVGDVSLGVINWFIGGVGDGRGSAEDDFDQIGFYYGQVIIKESGVRERPSHTFKLYVADPVIDIDTV